MPFLLTLWRFRQVLIPVLVGLALVFGYVQLRKNIRQEIQTEIEGQQIEQRIITIEKKQDIQRKVLSKSDSQLVDGILRSRVQPDAEGDR